MRVLDTVEIASQGRLKFEFNHQIRGGCSIDKHGTPITDEVLKIVKEESDAVLFGSVGGPDASIVEGTNCIVLRKNCSGAYFGTKVEEADFVSDSWAYRRDEVELGKYQMSEDVDRLVVQVTRKPDTSDP
ncbi:hypothetical protein AYO21_11988 [Fonsecaea monophora]|uniref:Isopropylmalate dehydrogenase-like domain-containing protein n=1 Tax=Fonsecaea monophora TaxID=254056 RepID=A0A177ES58_9EURO|nr:hypothetical protein AYO21_11988 [Fonsecaea monophora]KAH0829956.1 hypothetical protein FOPE_10765 [Fonsecaea pedrosoi]OAG33902.1 hypothetical protein AYO21_11988 [Fonsecaea monophora]